MTKKIILTLLIILLPIIIITASIDSVIFNKKTYFRYKNQVDNKEEIIINLLDYFKNNKTFIEQEGFTQEEINHFFDVKDIIKTIKSILLISIILTSMLLMNLFAKIKKKELRDKLSFYLISGSSITIIIIILIYLSYQNFNYFFTLFHSALFKAGTWIFPKESLSIRLFPIELFQGFVKDILTRISIISFVLLSIGMIYRKVYSFLLKFV